MRITPLGDSALLVEYSAEIDVGVNAAVLAASERVRQSRVPGVRDVVPAFASFAVHFDPIVTDVTTLRDVIGRAASGTAPDALVPEAAALEIPVCYGGTFGPDLPSVAAWAGYTAEQVVAAHTERSYRVFMLGFLPGFPYLAPVSDRIAMPRREAPRPLVAAGSVGIAGRQTGIYPCDSPGGWQIIGRTPLTLFDPVREPPALVAPGQRVRFRPISPSDFDAARTAGPRP
jgi:KipI family sensor histidine kinase inhibitor